jgi:MFS family permease
MMVLRFLQGFFGSPILSTGGASLSDISDSRTRPFALYTWAVFAFAGPSVGAVIAGYSIPKLGWRWSLWEIMICVGPAVILHVSNSLSLVHVWRPVLTVFVAFPSRNLSANHLVSSSKKSPLHKR